ncbi:hypothetical protein LPJ73_001215 [Coemansia sp. RSA 2703]|nr:hypothetical protein LPJ73_001215 [Coemansia sp. RSA 2703]KAJ2361727.1 hypothetical protein IW150_007171 [Coemansia sp. RSA 2607]KAJ2377774.1 hypothetical protein GGI05_006822 [Coemansia sp. RSA 2603]
MTTRRLGKQSGAQEEPLLSSSSQYHDQILDETEPSSALSRQDNDEDDIELGELRRVRRALSKMNQGIENVQHQMKYFNSNVSQTTQLLDIWVRILSQTAHNQSFLANEEWHGGSMDTAKLDDLAQRDRMRIEEAERKAREAEAQREREKMEARERERLRAEIAAAAEAAAAQKQQGTRPGLARGRRPPPGPAARGGRGANTRGVGARGAARGGRGRGSSIPSVSTESRIRPPR